VSTNPTNGDIRGVSFDDFGAGLIFFDDGYQGFGVISIRTRQAYNGTFNWFYNTNRVYSSSVHAIS
jgi:hypothetical protein